MKLILVSPPFGEKGQMSKGLTAVLVGWESNNLSSLEEYKAVTKQGRERRDVIKKIRDHGIEGMLFIMVGGRQDTREDFVRPLQHSKDTAQDVTDIMEGVPHEPHHLMDGTVSSGAGL